VNFLQKNMVKLLPLLVPFYKAEKDCDDEDKRIECEGLGLFIFCFMAALIICCYRRLCEMFIGMTG